MKTKSKLMEAHLKVLRERAMEFIRSVPVGTTSNDALRMMKEANVKSGKSNTNGKNEFGYIVDWIFDGVGTMTFARNEEDDHYRFQFYSFVSDTEKTEGESSD